MRRNKYVYGLANAALIACFTEGKGGTWTGACEELKGERPNPVFIRQAANSEFLLDQGGRLWSDPESWQDAFSASARIEDTQDQAQLLDLAMTSASETPQSSSKDSKREESLPPENKTEPEKIRSSESKKEAALEPENKATPATAYDCVLPLLLEYMREPVKEATLAEKLDIAKGQLQTWLKRAVKEQKAVKVSIGVYQAADRARNGESQGLLPI